MHKVAVVGMGYSGAILVERLKNLTPALKVDVYDPTGSTGSGQAYQRDNLSNLVNRPAGLMYLREYGDFKQWLSESPVASPKSYQPRPVFGSFIEETLKLSLRAYSAIQYRRERVIGISTEQGGYSLITTSGKCIGYNAVVLATGNPEPADIYRLKGTERYINNPFPTTKLGDIRSGSLDEFDRARNLEPFIRARPKNLHQAIPQCLAPTAGADSQGKLDQSSATHSIRAFGLQNWFGGYQLRREPICGARAGLSRRVFRPG